MLQEDTVVSYVRSCSVVVGGVCLLCYFKAHSDSVITEWNPVIVDATIRDAPPPTIGTHVMSTIFTCAYEAWAAYDPAAQGLYTGNSYDVAGGTEAEQEEAVCHAIYTVLS